MDWVNRMNEALAYIEAHLADEIDIARAAQIAACSEFHFQRMFAYIAGVTVTEYVRRRRMTLAAFDLTHGRERVLDIALKYGYESPTSFNRAFRSVHGVSPSRVRVEGIKMTAYPRITFTVSVKGEKAMDYKIISKEPFRIVGYAMCLPQAMEDCFEQIPAFWQRVSAQGGMEKLRALMQEGEPRGILGVCTCESGRYTDYYIAVATALPAPEGMEEYVLPETTYAVFEAVGPMPGAIQQMQQRVVAEWLPSSGYEYALAADIEVYPEGDLSAADYRSEVWLPIAKRA